MSSADEYTSIDLSRYEVWLILVAAELVASKLQAMIVDLDSRNCPRYSFASELGDYIRLARKFAGVFDEFEIEGGCK